MKRIRDERTTGLDPLASASIVFAATSLPLLAGQTWAYSGSLIGAVRLLVILWGLLSRSAKPVKAKS
jgi:hypothetical protein